MARETYKQRKRLIGNREKDTLARLNKFSDALKAGGTQPATGAEQSAPVPSREAAADGEGGKGEGGGGGDTGYDGKVRTDIDHKYVDFSACSLSMLCLMMRQ